MLIEKFEALLRRLRLWLRRSEWGVRLLGLSKASGAETEPGLVLIQIDGLSRSELERAIRAGRMPFLARLIEEEGYKVETFYSGVPATTPAVQGEIFYGVCCAVPSFGFRSPTTGKFVRMIESEAASDVEASLATKSRGLLEGGSSYSNIYGGGAAESLFCAANVGWGRRMSAASRLAVAGLIVLHAYSFVRAIALSIVELGIAIYDCIKGVDAGESLWEELKFIPKRVAVSIGLREAVTIGAEMDVARGLPIIHLNFLGYDEQSHRRGPASAFAHWTLKGIDHCIKRLWYAARASLGRDYEVWVYSDHGQFKSVPYQQVHGRTVEEAVAELFDERLGKTMARRRPDRAAWFGGPFKGSRHTNDGEKEGTVQIIAPGPIAHVYCKQQCSPERKREIARALVSSAGIPLVLVPVSSNTVHAFSAVGEHTLPNDAAQVLGADHPFLLEAAREFVTLCHHPAAGDFVLSTWRRDGPLMSFAIENGAHAGPAPDELGGFAVVPDDAPLSAREGRAFVRGLDLRDAALTHLKRSPAPQRRRPPTVRTAEHLRIVTYNVHSCVGMDGRMSTARIARVIARYAPDIVALQELDVGRIRTGGVDQAHAIAHELEMDFHFHAALRVEEEQYGNAILSRYPMRLVQAGALPSLPDGFIPESRGALWVTVDVGGRAVQLFNTHFGLSRRERTLQAEALIGPEWLGHPSCLHPIILCGDLNDQPFSLPCRRLRGLLCDAQLAATNHRPLSTWLGRYPFRRIDYVFVSPQIKVTAVKVPRTELIRAASDHLPLLVDLSF